MRIRSDRAVRLFTALLGLSAQQCINPADALNDGVPGPHVIPDCSPGVCGARGWDIRVAVVMTPRRAQASRPSVRVCGPHGCVEGELNLNCEHRPYDDCTATGRFGTHGDFTTVFYPANLTNVYDIGPGNRPRFQISLDIPAVDLPLEDGSYQISVNDLTTQRTWVDVTEDVKVITTTSPPSACKQGISFTCEHAALEIRVDSPDAGLIDTDGG